jgi:hypothetical protein
MKKLSISAAILLLAGLWLQAQNQVDALRYSNLQFFGTARYMGMAGAFGALGADFGTLSSNPAGLGLYKSSEFVITPGLLNTNITSKYQGESNEDYRRSLNFPNLGYVFASEAHEGLWEYVQFGFGMNKLVSYNSRSFTEGVNPHNSILDDMANQARDIYPTDLSAYGPYLAWDTYLLTDTFRGNNGSLEYRSAVPNGGVLQSRTAYSRGAINEMVLSLAGNYNNKLFIGGTIGFDFLDYTEKSTYRERDHMDSIFDFKSLSLHDELFTSGMGINFKLGMIYRPSDWLRVGAAIHSPTFFSMDDSYSRVMSSTFDNGDQYESDPGEGYYEYRLETPMRLIGSLALILQKYGLVSVDYEWVDYSAARLRSTDTEYSFRDANDAIDEMYTSTGNLRMGAELRLLPLYLRGGYAIYGSPYMSGINDASRTYTTFGLGIREQGFFIDLSYVRSNGKEDYYMYDPDLVNPAEFTKNSGQVVMTLGFTM